MTRPEAIRATSSLEWLRDHIECGVESERIPAEEVDLLREVADQLASARYTIASKSQTLEYVTRLHQQACAQVVSLRAQVAAMSAEAVA